MNKDLKDIERWRQLTEQVLREEEMEDSEEETKDDEEDKEIEGSKDDTDKWLVFIGKDNELEEGEEARLVAYQASYGEDEIVKDMSAKKASQFQHRVENENRETKQVDVVYKGDEYICNDDNVIFVKTDE